MAVYLGSNQIDMFGGNGIVQPILQTKTINPSESVQNITADNGYDGLDEVIIQNIPLDYVGSGIEQRDSTDLTINGPTIIVPEGYYENEITKTIANGFAGTPTATKGTVSNHSVSVTPSVTNTTGYITGGTKTGTAVNVSASELVSGSETKTSNGTYDVTNLAELIVNVSSGTSAWTHITSTEVNVTTTSTQATAATSLSCGTDVVDGSKIIYVRVRDKAGKRAGYFAGSDTFFINFQVANGATTTLTYAGRLIHRYTSSSQWALYIPATTTGYGVYGYSITTKGVVHIYYRYHDSYSLTIDGTYTVDVFTLDYPSGYPSVYSM